LRRHFGQARVKGRNGLASLLNGEGEVERNGVAKLLKGQVGDNWFNSLCLNRICCTPGSLFRERKAPPSDRVENVDVRMKLHGTKSGGKIRLAIGEEEKKKERKRKDLILSFYQPTSLSPFPKLKLFYK